MTTGGNQHTLYDYDHLGRLIKVTDPLGQTETYQYNANGNLTRKNDRNGSVIRSTYDAFGHCVSVRGTGADQIEDGFMKYQYSANGLLLHAENNNLSTTYQYDSIGRVIKETDSDGAVRQYSYDRNGNRTSFTLTVNGSEAIRNTYVYDRLNRLTNVSDLGKGLAVYAYDENGNRASLTYDNGITTAYTFNAGNMVTELYNQINGSTLSKYSYSYYLDGNQARITDHEGIVTRYQYDGAGRLFEETRSAGADNIITKTYTYDGFGNRSSLTVSDNGQLVKTLYRYDANNRLLLETVNDDATQNQYVTSYGYDPNGNQTSKTDERLETPANGDKPALSMTLLNNTQDNPYGNLQNSLSGVYSDQDENTIPSLSVSLVSPKQSNANLYQYDVFNRMTCATLGGVTAAYSYKHDGLRISKEVDGQMTKHLWDGGQIVLELGENGQTIDRYIRGVNLIYSDKNLYYLYNAHGDTVQLTDTLGTVIRDYAYDAFGNGLDYSLYDSNPFRYSGEYLDFESGNIYLRNRYYSPSIGRFLGEDPIRSGTNWYIYANNNSVRYVDPLGLKAGQVNIGKENAAKLGINTGFYAKDSIELFAWRLLTGTKASSASKIVEKIHGMAVFLDPGHGGKEGDGGPGDSPLGAIREYKGVTYYEKNLNLSLALLVRDLLESYGIQVYMSRDTDEFVSLAHRATMANDLGVDIFVSIHHNSSRLGLFKDGTSIYYAAKHDVKESRRLGAYLHHYVYTNIAFEELGEHGGVYEGDYKVLRETTMPAVITETGYMSSGDIDIIVSQSQLIANMISAGIIHYFYTR